MKDTWKFFGAALLTWATSAASAAPIEFQSTLRHGELSEPVRYVAYSAEPSVAGDLVTQSTDNLGGDDWSDDSYAGACGDLSNCCYGPVWKVRAGAVILTRGKPDDVVLARPVGGLVQISGGEDFDFNYAAGPEVSIERMLGDGTNSIEVRYFGNLDWNSHADYGNTGDIQIGSTELLTAFDVTSDYSSRLNSGEINLRHECSDRVTWLTGFRIIELNEKLRYDVDFIVPNLSGVNWSTHNRLYGAQTGADLKLWRLSGPVSVNSVFKAGIFGNDAENNFKYDVLGVPIATASANDTPVAFVGEIGVTSAYQVTQHFAVRGGYEMLWVNEVALASDQAQQALRTLRDDTINSSGDVFYHGALVGGEFKW